VSQKKLGDGLRWHIEEVFRALATQMELRI
jgi:hypothetical protein